MSLLNWFGDLKKTYSKNSTLDTAKLAGQEFCVGVGRRIFMTGMIDTPIWTNDEWDICCVLDACRVDLFQEICESNRYEWLPERTGSMWSVGSQSPEWISKTFSETHQEHLTNLAYISGNPFTGKQMDRWPNLPITDSDVGYLDEAWRDAWVQPEVSSRTVKVSTIPPGRLVDRAINVWRRRSELGINRLVVHIMQPHTPFRSRPEWFANERDVNVFGEPEKESIEKDIWNRIRDGELKRDDVWEAYRDNLEWALDNIALLRQNAEATIALTSDHGNAMGEWGEWGHPAYNPVPSVRKVPWLTIKGTDQETKHPDIRRSDSSKTVTDRLEALGYKESKR